MKYKSISILAISFSLITFNFVKKDKNLNQDYSDIKIAGAMKNAMWKCELGSSINLDTISNKKGLYGLGPLVYLTGEVMINDGKYYVSKVTSDSTMSVEETTKLSAPFFVYGNITEWNEMELPTKVKSIPNLESFIDEKTKNYKRPFTYKLKGKINTASIHIQNLPKGTKVSSPKEAHQGHISYKLNNENVEIVGFFSTEHKGIFTHHDSFLHMHLITDDKSKMGHLDEIEFNKMTLFLPKK